MSNAECDLPLVILLKTEIKDFNSWVLYFFISCILCHLHIPLWFAYKKLACAPDFYVGSGRSGGGLALGRWPVYSVEGYSPLFGH